MLKLSSILVEIEIKVPKILVIYHKISRVYTARIDKEYYVSTIIDKGIIFSVGSYSPRQLEKIKEELKKMGIKYILTPEYVFIPKKYIEYKSVDGGYVYNGGEDLEEIEIKPPKILVQKFQPDENRAIYCIHLDKDNSTILDILENGDMKMRHFNHGITIKLKSLCRTRGIKFTDNSNGIIIPKRYIEITNERDLAENINEIEIRIDPEQVKELGNNLKMEDRVEIYTKHGYNPRATYNYRDWMKALDINALNKLYREIKITIKGYSLNEIELGVTVEDLTKLSDYLNDDYDIEVCNILDEYGFQFDIFVDEWYKTLSPSVRLNIYNDLKKLEKQKNSLKELENIELHEIEIKPYKPIKYQRISRIVHIKGEVGNDHQFYGEIQQSGNLRVDFGGGIINTSAKRFEDLLKYNRIKYDILSLIRNGTGFEIDPKYIEFIE